MRQLRGQLQLCERQQKDCNQSIYGKDKELKELDEEVKKIDHELQRKNKEASRFQIEKNQLEQQNSQQSRACAKLKKDKLLLQEEVRRYSNDNEDIKKAIEGQKHVIQGILEATEKTNRLNGKVIEHKEGLLGEIGQRSRHVTVLDEQNLELENELDRFMQSDQEIRNKLADRNRSPLRLADLRLQHELRPPGPVGRPVIEPDLITEPHSRVEVVIRSPYGPPRAGYEPFEPPRMVEVIEGPRPVEYIDHRGAQTSPMNPRRIQYKDQDTANHLRVRTTHQRSREMLADQSPIKKEAAASNPRHVETFGSINDRVEVKP